MPLEIAQALNRLRENLVELNEEACARLTSHLLENGVNQNLIKETLKPALLEIGRFYETGRYFASSLLLAGRVARKILEIIHDETQGTLFPGRVILGSATNRPEVLEPTPMTGVILATLGFEVWDLGPEPSTETFLAEALDFQPNVVGLRLSGREDVAKARGLIKLIREKWPQTDPPFIFLSAPKAPEPLRKKIGADDSLASVLETMSVYHRLIMGYPFQWTYSPKPDPAALSATVLDPKDL
ncbi:MAG: B12-binding domain-containing protein [Deltaproteobacteria bacterium]|jgi:5-methyltetrahydrofolate--homocysteine methyltransferase|nr:B12-binding domain-containing protein [Deltaproteobacteria bacterium]